MNGGIAYFVNYFLTYLFSFYPACSLQFILQWRAWLLTSHSSRHCFPLFGAVSWNWKGFAVVWLILPPVTLCSPQQRCPLYFSPYALDQWLIGKSVKLCMQHSSLMIYFSDLVPQHAVIFFSKKIIWKQNQKISTWSIMIKHPHSSTNSANPSFNYSCKDFYPPHSHFLHIHPDHNAHRINNLSIIFLASNIVRLRFHLATICAASW